VLATNRRPQWPAALLTLVLAGLFDLLFLVVDELPATVPVALALLILEGWERWSEARAGPSADRRRWRREAGTPRPAR
jgi:hypothetical protein